METLKIQLPSGYEIDSCDKQSGEIKLKLKSIKPPMERIKTIADLLDDHGITRAAFDRACVGVVTDEVAYILLKMLTKSLNEGWIPNWNDTNQPKYYPWFEMGSSGFRFGVFARWVSHSAVGSRLCFKSRELAEYAGSQFTSVYKDFMVVE